MQKYEERIMLKKSPTINRLWDIKILIPTSPPYNVGSWSWENSEVSPIKFYIYNIRTINSLFLTRANIILLPYCVIHVRRITWIVVNSKFSVDMFHVVTELSPSFWILGHNWKSASTPLFSPSPICRGTFPSIETWDLDIFLVLPCIQVLGLRKIPSFPLYTVLGLSSSLYIDCGTWKKFGHSSSYKLRDF